jgi:hypothetical protein
MSERLDISDSFTWEEDLPRPQWDLLNSWVKTRVNEEDIPAAWSDIARQWLDNLQSALGRNYQVSESDECLLLAPRPDPDAELLLRFAQKCREALPATLPGVAAFRTPGKQVVVVLKDIESYYSYVSVFYSDGVYGGSAGMHIREGYPHVAMFGTDLARLENTLAHEVMHSALCHLTLPLWVEEGLTQMFEHDMTGRSLLQVDGEKARKHKRFWKRHGPGIFWRGEGFHRPDAGQDLSYELAEILMRLLFLDYRPRWFGLVTGPRQRLFAFLQEADSSDCGEAAARQHLGCGLGELAARFLGPGDWGPEL